MKTQHNKPWNYAHFLFHGLPPRTSLVKGHGASIGQFTLDSKKSRQPFFKTDLTGPHEIEIQVK